VHLFSTQPALTSVSFQAGLFSAVLTAFVVPKIQDLKVNPADESAYYQNQTVHMLDRISQQFASVDRQISSNYTPPLPYPTFHPSAYGRYQYDRDILQAAASKYDRLATSRLDSLDDKQGILVIAQEFKLPFGSPRQTQNLPCLVS
jgi:hypothetical protein